MKKPLVAAALSIAFIAAVWQACLALYYQSAWAVSFPLAGVGVACFFAWATFYAIGGQKSGFVRGLATNYAGVVWGMVMIFIWGLFGFTGTLNIVGAFVGLFVGAFGIVMQAHLKLFSFIPAAFIGSATFFALGATINGATLFPTLIGLLCGAILGYLSQEFSKPIEKWITPKPKITKEK
ncbi:MAG: DUF1097 domain-containing protein [Firmicutes bacterium]|nr:DUF1097 domain-containing protein [Bacillota bacterium]